MPHTHPLPSSFSPSLLLSLSVNDFKSLEELEDTVLEQASAMALLRSSVGEDERALAAVEQGEGADCREAAVALTAVHQSAVLPSGVVRKRS